MPDHGDARVTAYIEGVPAGRIVVGRWARLMVQRHVRDLEQGGERGLWFDASEVKFTLAFMECLQLSKGQWGGDLLVLEPWQCFIVAMLFGWKNKADNTRRFRTALIAVARKNGKSTLGAAIGLRLFVADNEPGAEVYTFATKLDQAEIVHAEAKRMVRKQPSLKRMVQIAKHTMSIAATDSIYAPLGWAPEKHDGLNTSGAIGDEIHAHPNTELWDVIDTSTAARRQPLLVGITTAGRGDDPTSLYRELKDYSVLVLEGTAEDDTWFAAIWQLDQAQYDGDGKEITPADDWTDEKAWIKANPNLQITVKLDDLQRKAKKAKRTAAASIRFKLKHLNIEVARAESWLAAGLWNRGRGDEDWYGPNGLRPEILERWRGVPCWAGGDLSSVADLTAVVLCFKMPDGFFDVLPLVWCPRENAIGRQRDRKVPYVTWAENGLLELTEGASVDYDFIRARLTWFRDAAGLDIQEIGLDPHNARYLYTRMEEDDGFNVMEHRQGFISMNDPIKSTEKLLLDGKIRHGGNRLLEWAVGNVVTAGDPAGNVKFDKSKAADKIDPAVALVMGVGLAVLGKEPVESVYKGRGVVVI